MPIYRHPSEAATKVLLSACDLPVEDLDPQCFEHFFGWGSKTTPVGVVGLQLYGNVALLRSLAVAAASRGLGYGTQLVTAAEAYALERGVSAIYLLTNTAEPLFASLGYSIAERASAREAIRDTQEFSSLCPTSATLMMKRLSSYLSF